MPICKLNDVKQSISDGQRLLGLDIGKKTIGLALSDAGLKIATPVKILYRTKFTPDVAELFKLIDEQNVGGVDLQGALPSTSLLEHQIHMGCVPWA